MAEALGGASALSRLQLGSNKIDNDGALSIVNAVKDKGGFKVTFFVFLKYGLCCVVVVVGGGGGGGALLSQLPTPPPSKTSACLPRCD